MSDQIGAVKVTGNRSLVAVVARKGTAGTIESVSATTLAPGSMATLVNNGTIYNAILAIGVPAGSVIRYGTGVPDNSVGLNGDYYLRTSNSNLYFRAAGTYSIITNLQGNTGATGTAATLDIDPSVTTLVPGASPSIVVGGTSGARTLALSLPTTAAWRTGSGAPSNGSYVVGDLYLNLTNFDLYQKTGVSTWTLLGSMRQTSYTGGVYGGNPDSVYTLAPLDGGTA